MAILCALRRVARQSGRKAMSTEKKRGRVMELCEKDLLARISLPDLLHNRSGKANSRVVIKLQSWKILPLESFQIFKSD